MSQTKNAVVRLLNVFIKALSEAKRIPKTVIFIPDWDILKYLNFYEEGARFMTSRIITWICTNISRAIQSKKDIFMHRKPGSVSDSEPQLMWVKMINRHGEFDRALTARPRFNRALEETLCNK